MIQLEQKHKKIIWDILEKSPYTFYAFGSRVQNKHQKFSDLDIFTHNKLSNLESFYLKDAFEESHLPFTVDIVQAQNCTPEFITSIEKDLTLINKETLGL